MKKQALYSRNDLEYVFPIEGWKLNKYPIQYPALLSGTQVIGPKGKRGSRRLFTDNGVRMLDIIEDMARDGFRSDVISKVLALISAPDFHWNSEYNIVLRRDDDEWPAAKLVHENEFDINDPMVVWHVPLKMANDFLEIFKKDIADDESYDKAAA
jgi:hypothetical protein